MPSGYPHSAGERGVDTSREAAESINADLAAIQRKVFADIRAAGANGRTSMECADGTGIPYDTVQPRTSELSRLGRIRDSGLRRLNPTGKRAIVWIAAGGGR